MIQKKKTTAKAAKTTATDYRSGPTVHGPFYSEAFQCWRIQFYAHGVTYEGCHESSILAERIEDAQAIAPYVKKVKTWQAWQRALPLIRNVIAERETKGWVHIIEVGKREQPDTTERRDGMLDTR